jgi:uncharacterized protein with HEPN domain
MGRDVDVILNEILEAISLIEGAVADNDHASFKEARFLQRGVERSLEIISEATRHLPDELLASRPEIAWSGIRAIGNLIRHEYWRIDPDIVWSVVGDDLPPLRTAIEALLRHHE